MGFSGKHIILKQTVDVTFNGRTDGLALQQDVTDWCHHHLVPGISEALENISTNGMIYTIDRLEIDVEVDASGNWMSRVADLVKRQLSHRLHEVMEEQNADAGSPPKLPAQLFVDAFIYFLEYGHLPWFSPVTTHHEWQEELENLLITGFGEQARNSIVNLLKQYKVQQRILYQVPDALFIKLMVLVNAGLEQVITEMLYALQQWVVNNKMEDRKMAVVLFKRSAMDCIYDVRATDFMVHVYSHFMQQLSANRHLYPLQQQLIMTGPWPFLKTRALPHLPETPHQKTKRTSETSYQKATHTPENKRENIQKRNNSNTTPEQEGIYISNAGLVIVAPFLASLFKKLGIADGSVLLDVNRAVCLAQYLASGKEWVAEFELGLAKILCGLLPDAPVDTTLALTDEERHEVNELLLSAIEYWEILKDTSPEGLRQSFLQRPGKMQFKNNEWLLQVEQKPWDMLLQHLPWNISMMKLPWMEWMLKTEWI